ncbi:MAG: 7-carboxy-7-deazaguanine synthase QueE, partial [Candidatus Methylumidiphilus sp.]
ATRHVCVTGGEPLAQPGCLSLLLALAEAGYDVSLETSGALDIAGVDPRVSIVMDLKTPSSGEMPRNRLDNIKRLRPHDQIKFVIMNAEDYAWAVAMLAEHALAQRCEVLFSPAMGLQDPAKLADDMLRDRLPVRFQLQLHKILWGDAPGK